MSTLSTPTKLPENISLSLINASKRTTVFLGELTSEQLAFNGERVPAAMPRTAFKNVKALAFIFRRKWGFIGGYARESGFLIKRQTAPDGTVSWSAPLFIQNNRISLGITIGYLNCGICYALMNEEAIQAALVERFDVMINTDFLVDMNGARLREAIIDSTYQQDNVYQDKKTGGMKAKYFRLRAMLVDGSISFGRLAHWKKANNALYGVNYSVDDVLSGKYPRPKEFIAVYEMLTHYSPAIKPAAGGNKGSHFRLDRSQRGNRSTTDMLESAVLAVGRISPTKPPLPKPPVSSATAAITAAADGAGTSQLATTNPTI